MNNVRNFLSQLFETPKARYIRMVGEAHTTQSNDHEELRQNVIYACTNAARVESLGPKCEKAYGLWECMATRAQATREMQGEMQSEMQGEMQSEMQSEMQGEMQGDEVQDDEVQGDAQGDVVQGDEIECKAMWEQGIDENLKRIGCPP